LAFQSIWYFSDLPEKIVETIEEDLTDITPITNAIEIVKQLEGVKYKWKDNHNQPSIGVDYTGGGGGSNIRSGGIGIVIVRYLV
jgi:hypothetical protein